MDDSALRSALAAAAEGYAFPTNLDLDQPVDGMAPQTQAELVWRALQESWPAAQVEEALHSHAGRRRTH